MISITGELQLLTYIPISKKNDVNFCVFRYVNKPIEKVLMCHDPKLDGKSETEIEVRRLVDHAMNFMKDHRYDLIEVYGEEYAEFCIDVPDPKKEPMKILQDFIDVLNTLG